MRKIFSTITLIILIRVLTNGQSANFEQVGNKDVRGNITEYVTENGVVFKIGDTLKIGYPFRQDCFAHITNRSNDWIAGLAGTPPPPLTTTSTGHIAVIKMMKATQRKLYVTTYAKGESVGYCITNFEEAFNTGEIVLPNYMTENEALEQLKKEKDKFDLGLITEEEYNKKKDELRKYIK